MPISSSVIALLISGLLWGVISPSAHAMPTPKEEELQGARPKAVVACTKLAKLRNDSPESYHHRKIMCIKYLPEDRRNFKELGDSYYYLACKETSDDAEDLAQKALNAYATYHEKEKKVDPDFSNKLFELSSLLNGEEEIRCLKIAAEGSNAKVLFRLGEIYALDGKIEEAEKYCEQAQKNGSDDALDYLKDLKKLKATLNLLERTLSGLTVTPKNGRRTTLPLRRAKTALLKLHKPEKNKTRDQKAARRSARKTSEELNKKLKENDINPDELFCAINGDKFGENVTIRSSSHFLAPEEKRKSANH